MVPEPLDNTMLEINVTRFIAMAYALHLGVRVSLARCLPYVGLLTIERIARMEHNDEKPTERANTNR